MKDPLEAQLKKWGEAHQIHEASLECLQQRIQHQLTRERSLNVSEPQERIRVVSCRGFSLAMAACILCFVFGWMLASDFSLFSQTDTPEFVGISDSTLRSMSQVYKESENLFGNKIRWLADSAEEVQMEIDPIASDDEGDGERYLVRLEIVERDPKEPAGEWKPVWTANILARNQEWVSLSPSSGLGHSVNLWAVKNEDGTALIDLEFSIQAPVRIQSYASEVVNSGEVIKLLGLQKDEKEYRLYQTYSPLEEAGG